MITRLSYLVLLVLCGRIGYTFPSMQVAEMNPQQMDPALMQMMQARAAEEARKQREDELVHPKKAEIGKDRAIRGSRGAPIMIVEYSDFQCPYCRRGFDTVEEVRKKYGKKVALIFKQMPLPFHPMAMPAALRFEAIAIQSGSKAYAYHDEVFTHQDRVASDGEKFLDDAAKKAGANVDKMKKDMDSPKVKDRINGDIEEAKKFGFSGTPGFLVAGVSIKGAYPASVFEEIIDQKLKPKPKVKKD